jgi:molecular chaperone DnaK
VQALKDTLTSEDAEQIKAKTEALGQVAMKLGEALYKAQADAAAAEAPGGPQGGPGPGAGGPGGTHGNDKVVDADFEEVDDQKKRGSA